MKSLLEGSQKSRAIANIFAGCSVVLFAILVYRIDIVMGFLSKLVGILFPFTLGFLLAFLLNSPLAALERFFHRVFDRFFKKRKPPRMLYRALSAVIMYSLLCAVVFGFLAIIMPQLVYSIRQLITSVTKYLNQHQADIEKFLKDFNWSSSSGTTNLFATLIGYWDEFAAKSLTYTGQLLMGIVNVSASVGGWLSDVFIGVIVSMYMLFGKETFMAQAKKLGCAMMPASKVEMLAYWFRKTHSVFSGYIIGQLLSSLVVGVVCYVVMLVCRIDYALLISVIVGITNILPVFGPIIGGVIGTVILLIVNPMQALWFAIIILLMQQLEGNIITPHILGDSLGISSFWIMLSIVVGGGLFGLPGILLGIPVFAVAYAVVQVVVSEKLEKTGMPPGTAAYRGDKLPERQVGPDGEAVRYHPPVIVGKKKR